MYFKLKRLMDSAVALVALILISPLMIIIAALIKVDSEGNVIFRQKRIGKNGIPFLMYKFRTMVPNAENMGTGVYIFEGDSRVTKIGRILRKTSLDELPQLWNIVKGEMAFVGPRPPVLGHFPDYDTLNDSYKRRFSVLPGITGLAQVVGRNDFSWDEKVKYDNIYIDKVKKYGFLYDAKIWIMTFHRVGAMNDVYETPQNMEKNRVSLHTK